MPNLPTAPALEHSQDRGRSVTSREPDIVKVAAALVTAHRWGDAARLHRRSAELRDADDPLGFRCLKEAAELEYASGDRTSARSDMTAAASHALARGDLRNAALA